jgi:hypothetical protein
MSRSAGPREISPPPPPDEDATRTNWREGDRLAVGGGGRDPRKEPPGNWWKESKGMERGGSRAELAPALASGLSFAISRPADRRLAFLFFFVAARAVRSDPTRSLGMGMCAVLPCAWSVDTRGFGLEARGLGCASGAQSAVWPALSSGLQSACPGRPGRDHNVLHLDRPSRNEYEKMG